MSTSPIISSNALNTINAEETATSNKPELTDNPPPQESLSIAGGESNLLNKSDETTKPSSTDEIPIIHHHQHQDQVPAMSTTSASRSGEHSVGSSSSQQIAPTTTMVSVIVDESEEDKDLLRSDYGNKSFYHLHALNDEPLSNYCKNYGESTEGNKFAKLARLINHFPNFNRKGMERFTLEGLKEMCLELGLNTEGKKALLIDRLFNLYIEKHKDSKLEFTFDTAKGTTTESEELHTHEEEEEEVNPKTGEPFRKSPRVAKRKQTEKDTSSKKTKSDDSITREYFMKHADDLKFIVDGKEHTAAKKSETHNSFGWHYSGAGKIDVGSHSVPVTYTFNAIVKKSGRKEESEEE